MPSGHSEELATTVPLSGHQAVGLEFGEQLDDAAAGDSYLFEQFRIACMGGAVVDQRIKQPVGGGLQASTGRLQVFELAGCLKQVIGEIQLAENRQRTPGGTRGDTVED